MQAAQSRWQGRLAQDRPGSAGSRAVRDQGLADRQVKITDQIIDRKGGGKGYNHSLPGRGDGIVVIDPNFHSKAEKQESP